MASAQVVETSVANNSPSQDSNHPDDLFRSRYVTPGFKPFSYLPKTGRHPYIEKVSYCLKYHCLHCVSLVHDFAQMFRYSFLCMTVSIFNVHFATDNLENDDELKLMTKKSNRYSPIVTISTIVS